MAGTRKYVEAVIAVILLIVLVFLAQLIVGVFGSASAQVNNTLVAVTHCQTTNSANALFCATNPTIVQFGQVGGVTTTIIPFITVIIVVALIVILLDLFGVDLAGYFRNLSG